MMGGITGFLTGLFFMLTHNVLTQDNMFEAWEFGLATATPCLSAIIVSRFMQTKRSITILVSYLTFVIPVLGASFGASGSEPILMFAGVGFMGGLFWSTPFALWYLFNKR